MIYEYITHEKHTNEIQVHINGIQITYEWYANDIRVYNKWHTSKYDWHMSGHKWDSGNIAVPHN